MRGRVIRRWKKYRCQYVSYAEYYRRALAGQILIRPFIKRIRDDECRGSSKARLLKQHFPAAMRQPRAYTSEQLISVTTGETHQRAESSLSPAGATTPVSKCAHGEHVFICARGRQRGEDDRCAITRVATRPHTCSMRMHAIATHPQPDDGRDK